MELTFVVHLGEFIKFVDIILSTIGYFSILLSVGHLLYHVIEDRNFEMRMYIIVLVPLATMYVLVRYMTMTS